MTDTALPVCVMGAGPSGLVSVKVLAGHGIDVECFELGSDVGGTWRYENDSGRSAAYASLHTRTSRDRMAFSDFPMPGHWPPYLHHRQVLVYLERYTERFGLRPAIRFRTRVDAIEPDGDVWTVRMTDLSTGRAETRSFRAVLVATGHHWDEYRPEIPGAFSGEVVHARRYRTPEIAIGRRVVVVGSGTTAADLAAEMTWHADGVVMAVPGGAHVVPRFLFGRPADTFAGPRISRLPDRRREAWYRLLLRLGGGGRPVPGLPEPDRPLLAGMPILSQDLPGLVRSGDVVVKPAVEAFDGPTVRFVDGTTVDADLVVFATGFRISLPFLPEAVPRADDGSVPAYRKVVFPDRPGLAFIGLVEPLGPLMPLAELQAEWVARLLRGAPLPDRDRMHAAIAEDRRANRDRYVDSPLRSIRVDFHSYGELLRREIAAAERRPLRSRPRSAPSPTR